MKEQEKVKNYVGIDAGKRELEVIRLSGSCKERFRVKTTREGENALLRWLKSTDIVVLEAGNQAFRIAKRIQHQKGLEVIILNPGDVATIYNSLKKTDKEDALKLARLAQRHPREELPEVSIPTDAEEDARRLATEQEFWIRQRTQGKNRLHSLFTIAGLTNITKKHLASIQNREKNCKLLPERYQQEAIRLLNMLKLADENLLFIENEMKTVLQKNSGYTRLAMSIPGIGPVNVLTLLAYLGECDRFSEAKQVSFYIGLVPKVDISGDQRYYGKIIKRGCQPIRRVIIQGAWSLVKSQYGGPIKEFYERLSKRIGKKKAIVATARKMLETFFVMIKNGELYRGVPDSFIESKLKKYGLT